MIPYKLRDFHIELTDLRHRIRGDPERDKVTEESPQLIDQYCARSQSHVQIKNELLHNFDKETLTKQRQLDLNLNGKEDNATTDEQSMTHHGSAIEDTKPVKIKTEQASSCFGKVSPIKLPDDWRSREIQDLATEVETYGVDTVIVREHLTHNHDNVAMRIKSEKKSLVLPSNWRDKIRDELIEDLCSENKLDKGLLDSELQQSEQVSSSPIKLKLPAEWRTMTRETLNENEGIMLES